MRKVKAGDAGAAAYLGRGFHLNYEDVSYNWIFDRKRSIQCLKAN